MSKKSSSGKDKTNTSLTSKKSPHQVIEEKGDSAPEKSKGSHTINESFEELKIPTKKEFKVSEKSLRGKKSNRHHKSDRTEDIEMKAPSDDHEERKSENSENLMDIVQEERELTLEVTSNIYCIEIFHSVFDTSQSFKIHKYLVKEESIKALKEYLPENLKIVSMYGISEVMKDCLNKVFESELPVFPTTEGIYLFYSPAKEIGVLAFITENEEMYKLKPIKSSSPFVTIIRTLTDLSFKIVACLSEDIIEKWFYEESGTLNPFKPKVHQSGGIMLKEVTVQESKIEKIELSDESYQRPKYYLTKDNLNFLFHYNFEEISEYERIELNRSIKSTCDELVKLNDVHMFHIEIRKVLSKIKMLSFNVEDLTQNLKQLLDQMISNRKQSREELCQKISAEIEEGFIYTPPYSYTYSDSYSRDKSLESKIKRLLDSSIIESKKTFYLLKNNFANSLKLKKEVKLDDIIEDSFAKYSEAKTKKELEVIIMDIVNDLRNVVQVKKKKINRIWKDMTLDLKIKEMVKETSLERKKNLANFQEFIKEGIKDFLGDPKIFVLKKIIKSLVEEHLQVVSVIEKSFKDTSYSYLSDLEKNSTGIEFHLKKAEFEVSEKYNKQLVCKIGWSSRVFRQFFPTKNLVVSQIISLEPEVIFVFLSNPEKGKTHVLRFNPKVIYKEDYEKCEDIDDAEVFVSWGSHANKFIMFKNTSKIALRGSLKYNKYFEKGVQLDIYSKISHVVSSFYLKKSRKLFIIDIFGLIYSKDFVNVDSEVCIVKSNKRVDGADSDLEPLKPTKGGKFLDIDISDDENIILLRSEVEIECFDKNFIQTHSIPVSENFLAYKSVIFGNQCFLLTENTDREMNCYKLIVPKHETQIESTKKINKIIDGNPIFDLHHLGLIKFGPLIEDTQIIKGQRYLGYYSLSRKNEKVVKYLRYLKEVKNNFEILGYINPSRLFDDIDEIEHSKFIFSVSVRIPLHIASIQNGNLVPLQNGVNNFEDFTTKIEKDSFLESLTDYIRFGNYEEVLENLKGMLVISIIGRQSSGKSYLLNRIAGTRFDVAAERCTEGIWMGIGYIGETPIVVFDCEGLFTVERSTQEEIKLCLFISSLSDLIILNSDLSSGKHIKGLFDEFASGVDRLKGKNLFKGYLDITFRDIPDSQGDGANLEFRKFVKSLLETGRKETLYKLFNKNILNSLYHNFENSMFDHEVGNIRNFYLEDIERKWSSETKLCLMMKLILVQIFLDDIISLDIRMFSAQTRKLRALIDNIISNPEIAKKHLKNEAFNSIIEPGPFQAELNLIINQFYTTENNPLRYFFDSIKESNYEDFRRKNHNSWYKQFDELIKLFFCERKNLITNFYIQNLPKAEEFKEQIEYEVLGIQNKLDKVANKFNLCLRKCEKCDFNCILFLNHERKCDCGTDHICVESCNICVSHARCNLLNGHKNRHVCKKLGHKCTEKCSLGECGNDCTLDPGHEDSCRCSSFHPCGKLCGMHKMCGQLCKFDFTIDHELHTCEGKCPFPCFFEDGNNCSSMNHFHDKEIKSGSSSKEHLCGTRHTCKFECSQKGVCGIKTVLAPKVYKNMYNEFTYPYVDLIPERLKCKEIIVPGEITHEKSNHICESTKHLCDIRCPDCNCFCDLEYGHDGYHSSNSHRNKDCSEYIATEKIFTSVFKNESVKTAVTYIAGDSATPEICDQYCLTKNRGHTHPIPCRGGDLCMAKTDKGFAIHSNEDFKSGSKEVCYYDFVTCDTYWKKLNWLPPNEKTPDVQRIFGKCNFTCGHNSHLERGEEVFCEGNLFHSMSSSYTDHDFKCTHTSSSNHDIVFIVDCTGSMGGSFPQVKNVIHNLMSKWGDASNKFAIVGYTDHTPDHGIMPSTIPVLIYPPSKRLEDGNATQAAAFINSMTVSGGGGKLGEALIDGLSEANKLQFRKDTGKIYILICDDSPHGDEFLAGTAHPRGCPCGVNWRDLLGFMKTKNVNFIFVKLSELLNKTVELFSGVYGQGITVMPLNRVTDLEVEVTKTVNQTIEKNFVFSKKFRSS